MQVSSHTNNYQALQTKQHPVTLPMPEAPKYSNGEIYEASNGNVIRGEDGKLTLTPQGETNLNNAREDAATSKAQEAQEKRDQTRGHAVDYLAASSKQSQVEIYLAVATDGSYSSDNKTADVISELRDVQKQNNAVEAYATYKESQNAKPALF